ncbi:hypothetical protein [Helicobacter pylori]|uniref:hypothetical protein n=1 Tax=Helicobacter pylori TaxID=210 RepID=UPI00095823F0|nr:hypothetical protein [Helicobacter pylori]BAW50413.1 uncharacterized protein HPF24_0974 [Helicobacter pylori]GHQ14171.1 hypothetical protein JP0058_12010 [Helicobacter pylori]
MPPLKGILADRNDSNPSCLCIFNGTISKDKILSNSTLQSFTIKYSQKRLELYGKVNQFILKGKIYG